MKKTITILLLFALVILSANGLFSCRSLKKTSSKADSTTTRIEETKADWDRTTITEIYADSDLTFPVFPSLDIHGIPVFPTSFVPGTIPKNTQTTTTVRKKDSDNSRPVIVITTHEKGNVIQGKSENKQVHVTENVKSVESGVSTSSAFTAVFSFLLILVIILLIIHFKK